MKRLSATLFIIAAMSAATGAAGVSQQTSAPAEELTEKIRVFLKKEMRLLAEGGRKIEAAIASGDSATVAAEAAKMHETFVHKQDVTTFDLRILKAVLGEDFVSRDKDFHDHARALDAAARAGDSAGQQRQFQAMLQVCAACHTAYAPEAPILE